MRMRHIALFLAFLPAPAWAIDGWTIFNGPAVPILESVEQDFPRHDLGELCRRTLPETTASTRSAQTACKAQQGRLAGLASQTWNLLPPGARRECVDRAEGANGYVYSVLYACVNAAAFSMNSREKMGQIAELIARQNGKVLTESRTVSSIR